MAKARTTTIAIINADERGFVTRKQCRAQMREALKGLGLTCGLMESDGGKRYTATITNSKVTITAERKVGAKVVANATKKALKALAVEREVTEIIENDPLDLLGSSDEPEIVIAPKAKAKPKAKKQSKRNQLTLGDFSLLSMDEQGRLTSTHPRDGGLSAGAIRAMLTTHNPEFADVPGNFKKADLVELLFLVAEAEGDVKVAPAPKTAKTKAKSKGQSNVLPFMTTDLGVDDLTF